MDNLWPDLDITPQRTPLSILREQAAMLGQKTQNLVTAEVHEVSDLRELASSVHVAAGSQIQFVSKFSYAFYLVAPTLEFYRYQLFRISYPIDLYPVHFYLDRDVSGELNINPSARQEAQDVIYAHTESEFVEILKQIFSARKILKVIQAIYNQSQSTGQVPALAPAD